MKNLEADVVVIGGGGAGLPAALTALEEGAGSVIVLEKRFAPGGNALRCNHIFAVESPLSVKINERVEVLDKQDIPIPGFYAAGVITSGWESHDYGGTPPGSAMSFTITSGRIAGKNAARYARSD